MQQQQQQQDRSSSCIQPKRRFTAMEIGWRARQVVCSILQTARGAPLSTLHTTVPGDNGVRLVSRRSQSTLSVVAPLPDPGMASSVLIPVSVAVMFNVYHITVYSTPGKKSLNTGCTAGNPRRGSTSRRSCGVFRSKATLVCHSERAALCRPADAAHLPPSLEPRHHGECVDQAHTDTLEQTRSWHHWRQPSIRLCRRSTISRFDAFSGALARTRHWRPRTFVLQASRHHDETPRCAGTG